MSRRTRLDPQAYVDGICAGNTVALSRAITLIESRNPQDRILAREVLQRCLPYSGKSIRIGITGVPGVGKSTFIDVFGIYLTEKAHKVAVLAIDPSSQISHGSIMGDKTRMEQLSHSPLAFIRPSPTGRSLGGVAQGTRETIILCEAAGFDVIIVETVGVGQSETTVRSMVDFFLLLLLANSGDELQGIKRGIMEIIDAAVINKADGSNADAAKAAQVNYESALRLLLFSDLWKPPVLTCSAIENQGISEIWQTIEEFRSVMKDEIVQKRHQQRINWLEEIIENALYNKFFEDPEIKQLLKRIQHQVSQGEILPTIAAENILQLYFSKNQI